MVLVAPVVAACSSDSARLRGHLIGLGDRYVYLERVDAGGGQNAMRHRQGMWNGQQEAAGPVWHVSVVDSALTAPSGRFRFRISVPDGQPTIFNLRANGRGASSAGIVGPEWRIPLLISAGECVNVMSFGNPERGYRVSGSPQSELVARVHSIMAGGTASLDSISRLFVMSPPDMRWALSKAYSTEYYRIKRAQVQFIVDNSSSLAAVYALGERLPGENALVGGGSDIHYYRMVADSAGIRYPGSQYIVALNRSLENSLR